MHTQKPPARNPVPQASLPGLTPSPINPTPFPVGVPLDILDTATRRISELVDHSSIPLTLRQILHDAIVNAYQRGKTEERAEANLLMESMDKINDRRHERLTELVVMQCMDAMCASEMTVDLSRSLSGNLTMRLDDELRHVVHYTYQEDTHED